MTTPRRSFLALLLPLLAVGCGKRPPMGDPDLQNALSFKALDESDVITACLRKDGVRANLTAIVAAKSGRILEAQVTNPAGSANKATLCLEDVIRHWSLDPRLNGQASLILADDSADQDARTAKAEVAKTVGAHESSIEACHAVAVDRSEDLPPSGLILVAWNIERRRAINPKVMSNDTGDAQLAQCIVAEVQSWNFPSEALGDVDWSFEFTGTGPKSSE